MYSQKKVVCIGGGTGISTMLRGLKLFTSELSAIVTVADNGGSSGKIRREMNILPPGDIRNCILALAETEPIMQDIFQHRFQEGSLAGQNLGNLFLAALTQIYGSFELAVDKANEVLKVKGQVLPVTTENVELLATYEDNTQVLGEHEIVYTNKIIRKRIEHVELVPEKPKAYSKAIDAILKADIIVLGPGSLYTSIIPNLLVEGVSEAIKQSKGVVVYVCNIMTQPGETDKYTMKMHVNSIEKYLGKNVIQHVIFDETKLDKDVEGHYLEDDAVVVKNDFDLQVAYNLIKTDFAIVSSCNKYLRHDATKLAEVIMAL
jgi:uncharacterized cofD-like protein